MKKKFLGVIAVLAIASVTIFNVNFGSKSSKLSYVSLANVEALATAETAVDDDAIYAYEEIQSYYTNETINGKMMICHIISVSCVGSGKISCTALGSKSCS